MDVETSVRLVDTTFVDALTEIARVADAGGRSLELDLGTYGEVDPCLIVT
jgi:hypothetical protein